MIDKGFCKAVVQATARIKEERDGRDACPRGMGGCGVLGALYSVSQRGITCGKFCGYCGWSTLFLARAKGESKSESGSKQGRAPRVDAAKRKGRAVKASGEG